MIEVHRENEAVPGGLAFFAGDGMIAFYPAREFGYGAAISVALRYEGKLLARSAFTIRPLPTLLSGFVADQYHDPIEGLDVMLEDLGIHTTTDARGAFQFGFGNRSDAIRGGTHRVVVNAGLANVRYGAVRVRVTPQEGRLTSMGMLRAPQLVPTTPFAHIASRQPVASVGSGNVVWHLDQATLVFPNGQQEGDVHAQAYRGPAVAYPVATGIFPLLTYGMQPAGIRVSGTVGVDFALPAATTGMDWTKILPSRVVLLGVDPDALQLVPVGVGIVDKAGLRVRSEGPLVLGTLDFIGLTILGGNESQTTLAKYAEGGVSLRQIASLLQGQ
jgi:hypothetical protein